jgi:hypothetical protein
MFFNTWGKSILLISERFCKTLKIEREREREREKRSRKETNLLHSHVHAQNVAPHFIKFTNREIRQISLSACKITVLLNRCCYAFVIGLLLSSCSLHSFAHPVESLSKNPSMNGVKGVWSVQASLSHHTTTLLSLSPPPIEHSFSSWQYSDKW